MKQPDLEQFHCLKKKAEDTIDALPDDNFKCMARAALVTAINKLQRHMDVAVAECVDEILYINKLAEESAKDST